MVAVVSQQEIHENGAAARPTFLLPERENGVPVRRPRAREVPSRYMSPSSSTTTSTTSRSTSSSMPRRFPSPLVSRTNTNSTPKRSQSVDRRRPATVKPANPGEVSEATKLLVTSTRSLSVSFQGEVFSLPISKTKPVNLNNNVRKSTPERRVSPWRGKVFGDQLENSKPVDQQRWPGRTRQFNLLSRSLNCCNVETEVLGSGMLVRKLQQSLDDESSRASFDGVLNLTSSNADALSRIGGALDSNSVNESSVPSDLTASDTESVSSGSTSGAQESNFVAGGQSGPGIMVSARFWQETNMRLRRLQDSGSVLLTNPMPRKVAPPKFNPSRKYSDCPLLSLQSTSTPIRGAMAPASPGKLITSAVASPLRGFSPSRVRSSIVGSMNGHFCDTPSVLSFSVDIRRGRVGENRIAEAHQLRLLYNRHLQWRFVNARADAALLVQRQSAEKNLWNAWLTTTGLRDSVRHKRTLLQLMKQKLKLTSILRGQMPYLEEWSHLDKEHSISLHGAIEALKASTLRLPVVGGAIADIQSVKEAVGSSVDVMQAMASSMHLLLTKVEDINSLVAELADTAAKERALLQQCKHILYAFADMQVRDYSLRTHILQLNRLP
ncbi:hypothetical protein Nepgr_019769 [Nepenthes gracilis]|uniref:QWRF motif-containing protein 2 n=1 Tax=Nepenthes gracilis TaxID=150966 RepID=A0AAD3SU11_NEPGR|nr:hypothetical protein Nepgr_019769 [Nepenthes gracilis]